MFGTLKPHLCVLDDERRADYDRFYCGLCKGLGAHYGVPARALLHHDAVFMALLVDGLQGEAGAHGSCRCPVLPVVHRPTVVPGSVAMRYAAAVQVLLGDQWLADRAMDGGRVARAARGLLAGHVAAARALLDGLGLPTAPLAGFEERQAAREVRGVTTPEDAAAPTAAALGHVFACVADLPGGAADARGDAARAALRALGEAVGRAIYHRDALEDLRDDFLGGAFNPCLARVPGGRGAVVVSPARVERTAALLARDVAAFGPLLDALPLRRHGAVLRNVLTVAFAGAAARATARARQWTGAQGRALLAACAAWTWRERALARVALAVLALAAWLARAGVALAQPQPGTGTGTRLPVPRTPHPRTPCAGPCDDVGGACARACTELGAGCKRACTDCGHACDGCRGCGGACSSCDACGRDCGQCGNSCRC